MPPDYPPGEPYAKRFTAIWQSRDPHEFQWIGEIFGSMIREHIFDGEHAYVCDDALLIDAFLLTTPPAYFEQFRGRRSFLIHFLDENYDGGYARYEPFLGVFRKHWTPAFASDLVHRLPLGYANGFGAPAEIKPASARRYAWSFVGAAGKSSRPDAIRAMARTAGYKLLITDDFAPGNVAFERGRMAPAELALLLQESAFAPSPMGNVNLECFRTYEALEAGAIPLVERRLTLDYYRELFGPNPLPAFRSWRQAAAFARDLAAKPAELDQLQADCVEWWSRMKQLYRSEVADVMESALARGDGGRLPDLRKLDSRRWQYPELLRHQTFATIARRIERQAARVIRTGKWRVAHGA